MNNSICTIVGSFEISDEEICDMIILSPSGTVVSRDTAIELGQALAASMGEIDLKKFWHARNLVPPELWRFNPFFPLAYEQAGVAYVSHDAGGWRHDRMLLGIHYYGGIDVPMCFRRKHM